MKKTKKNKTSFFSFFAEKKHEWMDIFQRTVYAPLEAYSSSTHKEEIMPFGNGLFFFLYQKKNVKIFKKTVIFGFSFFSFEKKKSAFLREKNKTSLSQKQTFFSKFSPFSKRSD
jgi:hypothetical protein